LLRSLAADLPIEFHSYGLYDLGPEPPLREALVAAERLEIDISQHRARPLRGENLAVSDLVLGFERIHVATAVVEAKARRDRTFTLPELVGLLEDSETPAAADPLEHARLSVSAAHERRAAIAPEEVFPEVADPWSKPNAVYAETARAVDVLCRRLARQLFGITS
jgi:protein-tyrosine-phosphatase